MYVDHTRVFPLSTHGPTLSTALLFVGLLHCVKESLTLLHMATTPGNGVKDMTRTMYEIREYKTPSSYSSPMGSKLRPRHRALKLMARLTLNGHRDLVLVRFVVNV